MQVVVVTILGFMLGIALHASLRPATRRRKHNEEMSLLPTSVLGIGGSAFGYAASTYVVPYQLLGFQPAGLAASALLACTLVLVGDWVVALRRSLEQQHARTPTQRQLKQQA